MATGGSIESVSIRGRLLPVAADSGTNLKLGGFENEIKANGDGTARMIKTRVPWMISGLKVEIDHDRADQEFLKEIADGKDFVPVAVTFASGAVYQGKGQVSGEFQYDSQESTAEITLSGPGEATQQ